MVKQSIATGFVGVVLAFAAFGCSGVPAKASPDDPAGNFSVVESGLYRGGRPDQAGVQRLAQMGVKTIVDLENDDAVIATERGWAEALGITFVSAPLSGTSTPPDDVVNVALGTLEDMSRRPAYVHCMKGQDRTGVIVALYRVFHDGWTPKDAHDEMEALGFNNLLLALHDYFADKTGFKD